MQYVIYCILFVNFIFCFQSCDKNKDGFYSRPAHGEFPNVQIKVNNQMRTYRLYAPSTVSLTDPTPLVFAFHGMGIDNKDLMPLYTGLNKTANENKFILVYPQALNGYWARYSKDYQRH